VTAGAQTQTPATRAHRDLSPPVRQALAFTEVYRGHEGSHPAAREAACLRAQFPALLAPLQPGDVFAGGHVLERITYVGTIWWAAMPERPGCGKQGGYCFDFNAERFARTDADRAAIAEITGFWREECTWTKIRRTWDEHLRSEMDRRGPVGGGGSGFCLALDLDRLLQLGIPGTATAVRERVARARREGETGKLPFLEALADTLGLLADVCGHYEAQAAGLAQAAGTAEARRRLRRIADSLHALTRRPPGNLHEAIQLWWLYSLLACGRHVEGWRLDVALGGFYAAEADADDAMDLVRALWRLFDKHSDPAVSRAIIGGRGRRNEPAADRFCLAAMDVTRELHQVIPQLTLRFYDGQDPALLDKAWDVIADGATYPMLYNDDVNIPAVAAALHVSPDDAVDYYPLGCGEYMIGGASPSLLNTFWSIPESLEAALREGIAGPRGGFADFRELRETLSRHLAAAASLPARVHAANAAVMPRECACLLASLFTRDCLERGRSIIDGGARTAGACIMGHGFTNAADALMAIKRVVFEEQAVDQTALLAALDANFEGYEPLRRRLLAAPKFGNDHDGADALLVELWREINRCADEAGREAGLDFLTVSSVNPGGYFLGLRCGATPDGRFAHVPFAIGNAPTAGADTEGLTALLNSVSKVDPANGGATTNVKLEKSLLTRSRSKIEALFDAYWKNGGIQAMVTVADQAELEDAMIHPDRHANLLVRVGGFTARFVDLEEHIRREIIRRTSY
jgi:pyruvate-formate lyase